MIYTMRASFPLFMLQPQEASSASGSPLGPEKVLPQGSSGVAVCPSRKATASRQPLNRPGTKKNWRVSQTKRAVATAPAQLSLVPNTGLSHSSLAGEEHREGERGCPCVCEHGQGFAREPGASPPSFLSLPASPTFQSSRGPPAGSSLAKRQS